MIIELKALRAKCDFGCGYTEMYSGQLTDLPHGWSRVDVWTGNDPRDMLPNHWTVKDACPECAKKNEYRSQ